MWISWICCDIASLCAVESVFRNRGEVGNEHNVKRANAEVIHYESVVIRSAEDWHSLIYKPPSAILLNAIAARRFREI